MSPFTLRRGENKLGVFCINNALSLSLIMSKCEKNKKRLTSTSTEDIAKKTNQDQKNAECSALNGLSVITHLPKCQACLWKMEQKKMQEPEMVANSKGTAFSRHGRAVININSATVTACNRLV